VAHYTDVGGRVAGGNASDSTEIYQEGLRLPPLLLVEAGVPQEGLFRLIARNVRVPRMVLGDLRAQLAACHTGVRETASLLSGRYGPAAATGLAAFQAETAALVGYAERFARAEIAALPQGTFVFQDALDGDGIDPDPIPIRVAVTVAGDRIVADFAGSAPQVRGAINCPLPFTRSVVYACVRCLLSRDLPNNGGYFRAIEVRAPEGSIVNPLPPAPVAARGLTGFRIANTVFGALAKVAPHLVPACESGGDTGISLGGYDAARQPFVYLEFLHGSWGGRPRQDGIDASASVTVNFSNTPLELVEAHYPLRIERYGFLPDSGGAGTFRGGLGMVKEYRFLETEASLQVRADRQAIRPYGLAGGEAGAPGANLLARAKDTTGAATGADPAWARLPAKALLTLYRGDLFRHVLPGAGGWGDPWRRDPSLVLEDVVQEKVTVTRASADYGVVLRRGSGGALEVDDVATAQRRSGDRPPRGMLGG
jgi:N-methylhydantoinase B